MFMSEQDFLGESSAAPEPFPDLSDFEYLDADFPFGELENGNVWNSFFAGDHSANLSFLPRCPSPTIPVGPALTPLSGFPLSEWSLNVEPEQRHNTLDVPRVIASHSPPPQPAMRISPPSFVAPHFPMILPLPTFSPQHPEQHRPFRHKVQLPKSPAGRSGAIPNRSQKRGQIVGVSINESEFVQVTKGESHLMLNPATLTIQVGSFSVKNDSHLIGDASALGIRVSSSQPSEMLVNDTPKHENKKMALKLNYSDISCRVGQERTQKGTNTRFVVTVTIDSVSRGNRDGLERFGSGILGMLKGAELGRVETRTVGVIVERHQASANTFAQFIADRTQKESGTGESGGRFSDV